jgi:hypothetical protein
MPNGWSINWESMATRERGKPGDALCRELACYLCAICVLAISNTIFVSLDRIHTSK